MTSVVVLPEAAAELSVLEAAVLEALFDDALELDFSDDALFDELSSAFEEELLLSSLLLSVLCELAVLLSAGAEEASSEPFGEQAARSIAQAMAAARNLNAFRFIYPFLCRTARQLFFQADRSALFFSLSAELLVP